MALDKNQYKKILIIGLSIVLLGVAAAFFFRSGDYVILGKMWVIISNLWWLIFPVPMWMIFKEAWKEYSEKMFLIKQNDILLEIKPPAETEKSPKIMEQVFASLYTFSGINKFEKYCGWRPLQDRFSFEIASLEGDIHFYVLCPSVMRNPVEAHIYAQYPDAEIFKVEDYTKNFPKNLPNKDWDIWGSSLKLRDADAMPIRTYRKFQEDVTGKMIDPLASITEALSTLKKGQNSWFQIIFTPAADADWIPEARAKVDEIIGKSVAKNKRGLYSFFAGVEELVGNMRRGIMAEELQFGSLEEEEKEKFNINQLPPGKQEELKAIEENISKVGFMTSMRFVHVGKREVFNKAEGVAGFLGPMNQFADVSLNAIVPDNRTKTFANYYFTEPRLAYRQRKIVQDYRDRAFAGTHFYFNTEELATVFHLPDMSVTAPTIQRIEAKKGQAPDNLPV
jgi:hypothetical protein